MYSSALVPPKTDTHAQDDRNLPRANLIHAPVIKSVTLESCLDGEHAKCPLQERNIETDVRYRCNCDCHKDKADAAWVLGAE